MKYSLIKTMSIAITALAWILFKNSFFGFFLFSIGIAHYFVAAVYSYPSAKKLTTRGRRWIALLIVGGTALYFVDQKLVMIWVFCFHYIFTEVYVGIQDRDPVEMKPLIRLRYVLNALVYFTIIRKAYSVFGPVESVLIWLYVGLLGLYLLTYSKSFGMRMPRRSDLDFLIFDLLSFAVGIAFVVSQFSIKNFDYYWPVMYHFIFWIFYPIEQLKVRPLGLVKYAGLHLVFTVISSVFVYWSLSSSQLNIYNMAGQSYFLLGNIHIFATLMISKMNPQFLRYLN